MKIRKLFHALIRRIARDHVNVYASQSAYFIILSAFPFAMLLLTLLRYSPLTYEDMLGILEMLSPRLVNDLVKTMLADVYERSNLTLISFSILFVIWSSGSGIMSITRGINEIYHIHETRNYFHLRLIATLYTILLAIALLFTLGVLVFGKFIYNKLLELLPFIHEVFVFVISIRTLMTFGMLMIFFIFIYKVMPNKKTSLWHVLPGAVISAAGWIVTTSIYSVYVSYSRNFSYMYGSLAGIMAIMLWLYVCMFQLFLGAEINNLLHPETISGDSYEDLFSDFRDYTDDSDE